MAGRKQKCRGCEEAAVKIAELERRLIELEEKLAKSEKNSSNLFSAFRDLIIGRFLMASFWSHVAEAVSFLSLYAGFLGSRSVGR
jgi:hypothetical protein